MGVKQLRNGCIIIAQVWITGVAPADWIKALIVPVLKKGNPTELDNYRGISLLSIPGKEYALILRSRLEIGQRGSCLKHSLVSDQGVYRCLAGRQHRWDLHAFSHTQ